MFPALSDKCGVSGLQIRRVSAIKEKIAPAQM
jgi:hypothetical protein